MKKKFLITDNPGPLIKSGKSQEISPISVREELVLDFQVRQGNGKWRKARQFSTVNSKRKPFHEIERGKGKVKIIVHKKFKNIQLGAVDKRPFNQIRIGNDVIFRSKSKKVRQRKLERIIKKPAFERHDEVLVFINLVREWAQAQGLSVGGFPLVPETKVLKKSVLAIFNPIEELHEGEERFGYYGLVEDFIKNFGVGQVWGEKRTGTSVIRVTVGMFGQSGWREYKDQAPRFYTKTVYVDLTDEGEMAFDALGVDDIYSREGRQATLDYIVGNLDLVEQDDDGDFIAGPLGVIGWAASQGEGGNG